MMDYHISGVPNNALSNALNATFITYNGNEAILQNDLGNGRVESAYLPEGFIPLGTTSFGGIIYIVSYNPLNKHVEIGSYPSPLQVNALDSDDFDAELKSIIQEYILDAGKTEGNYSELITKINEGKVESIVIDADGRSATVGLSDDKTKKQ